MGKILRVRERSVSDQRITELLTAPGMLLTTQITHCLAPVASVDASAKHLAVVVGVAATVDQSDPVVQFELMHRDQATALSAMWVERPYPHAARL